MLDEVMPCAMQVREGVPNYSLHHLPPDRACIGFSAGSAMAQQSNQRPVVQQQGQSLAHPRNGRWAVRKRKALVQKDSGLQRTRR